QRTSRVVVLVTGICSGFAATTRTAAAETGTTVVALTAMTGTQEWTTHLGFAASGTPPAAGNGRVYVAGGTECASTNAERGGVGAGTGRVVWRVRLPGVDNLGGPVNLVSGEGRVVVALSGQPKGLVEAFDASTGKLRWKASPGRQSYFLADGGNVVF